MASRRHVNRLVIRLLLEQDSIGGRGSGAALQLRALASGGQRTFHVGPTLWHASLASQEREQRAETDDQPSEFVEQLDQQLLALPPKSPWTSSGQRSFAEAGLDYSLHHRRLYSSETAPRPTSHSSATSTATPAAKKAPDAADCDSAIGTYVDVQQRLANLKKPSTLRSWDQVVRDGVVGSWNITLVILKFLVSVPSRLWALRKKTREEWSKMFGRWWQIAKEEGHHYWVGTKLLGYDIKIATRLALKAARGHELSRRERRQLTRTTADIFRLVPMIIILVIPFMELALPILLKLFPNMLPSTYEDKLKKEEALKRGLSARLEVARFLQDTVAEMADDLSKRGTGRTSATATDLYAFINKVRAGEPVTNGDILRFSQLFNDELTLDNLERVQLVTMCQFVGISPFGTDQFLRTRLRLHLQKMKKDDYAIEQEGLENLTVDELRAACRARGMRAPYGEGAAAYMRRKMQDWLDLSLHRGLPSSLLLLSRAFTITATPDVSTFKDAQYSKLKETLSVMPPEVVEAVESSVLTEGKGPQAAAAKLELIKREEELIREEQEALALAEAAEKEDAAATMKAATAAAASLAHGAAEPAEGAADTSDVPPTEKVPLSEEERAAKSTADREKKINSIVTALGDLMNRSGVVKERSIFLDLVATEVQRLNKHISERTGPTSSLVFTNAGLQAGGSAPPSSPQDGAGSTAVSAASKRVSKMLQRIEKELDSAEASIGNRLHVLDVDGDGKVSREELQQALAVLRESLSPDDLQLLYSKLGGAAAAAGAVGGTAILVTELLAAADAGGAAGGTTAAASGSASGTSTPSSGDGAVAAEAARMQSERIHTQ